VQRKQTNQDQNNNDKINMGNIYILQSSNTESHQYIRIYKSGNILQEYQHHTTTPKPKTINDLPGTGFEWNLQTQMQHRQTVIHRADNSRSQTKISRTYYVHET